MNRLDLKFFMIPCAQYLNGNFHFIELDSDAQDMEKLVSSFTDFYCRQKTSDLLFSLNTTYKSKWALHGSCVPR